MKVKLSAIQKSMVDGAQKNVLEGCNFPVIHMLILLEFKFTETKWEVSYMHNRITDYDYKHRLTGDITDVIIGSDSLINATIWLVPVIPPRQYKYLSNYSCKDLTDYTHVTHDISQAKCVQQCTKIGDSCVMMNYFTYFKSTDDARCYLFDKLCHISLD
eukprot:455064_1